MCNFSTHMWHLPTHAGANFTIDIKLSLQLILAQLALLVT
jgi:hypothetical protein